MCSGESCCVALFREPIKWLVFDIQTHVSVLRADQFHITVFRKFISRDKKLSQLFAYYRGRLSHSLVFVYIWGRD